MEGVVKRGKEKILKRMERKMEGKKGKKKEEKDEWLVGLKNDIVVGVLMGYDKNNKIGRGNKGGGIEEKVLK